MTPPASVPRWREWASRCASLIPSVIGILALPMAACGGGGLPPPEILPADEAVATVRLGPWAANAINRPRGRRLSLGEAQQAQRALASITDSLPAPLDAYTLSYLGLDQGRPVVFVRALPRVDRADLLTAWGALFDPSAATIRYLPSVHDRSPRETSAIEAYGQEAYERKACGSCHALQPNSERDRRWADQWGPPLHGWATTWRPLANGDSAFADETYFRRSVSEPAATVAAGYPDAMPSYVGQLRPEEVTALWGLVESLAD